MTKKRVFSCAVLAFVCSVSSLFGGTYHWTGATDGDWGKPSNWQEGAVPGVYKSGGATFTNDLADIAVFGAVATGAATTIDLANHVRVTNLTIAADAPAYTFGKSSSQQLTIISGGRLEVESGCAFDQVFAANVALGTASLIVYVYQNGSGLLDFQGDWVYVYNSKPNLYGTGDIRISGAYAQAYQAKNGLTGKFIVNSAKTYANSSSFKTFESQAGATRHIEILSGKRFNLGDTAKDGFVPAFWANTVISGEGELHLRNGSDDNTAVGFKAGSGSRVEIGVPVVIEKKNIDPTTFTMAANGTLALLKSLDCATLTDLNISDGGTLEVTKIGVKGCDASATSVGANVATIHFLAGGTVRYVGSGETTDRALSLEKAQVATLANKGTGTLVYEGAIAATVAGTTLKLDATTAPIEFGGTLASDENAPVMTVVGASLVTMKTQPAFAAYRLEGGNIAFDGASAPAITIVKNANTVTLAAGQALSIASLSITAGTVDFIVPDDASVTLANKPASLPSGVTVNGYAARVDSEGRIHALVSKWKAAADGAWNEEGKWTEGVPLAEGSAMVTAAGSSYTVDAAGLAVVPTTLEIGNAAEGQTATVAVSGDHDFSSATITLKEGGVFKATEGVIAMPHASPALAYVGGSLIFDGPVTNSTSGGVVFGSGVTEFANGAALVQAGSENATKITYVMLKPNAAGETATMNIEAPSGTRISNGTLYIGGNVIGGRSVLNASGTGNHTPGNCIYSLIFGYKNGVGEVNLSGGVLYSGNYGVFIGSPRVTGTTDAGSFAPTGLVSITGGELRASGWGWAYSPYPTGLVVGDGAYLNSSSADVHCYGRIDLSGGKIGSNQQATLIGAGKAKGEIVVTGGEFLHQSWMKSDAYPRADGLLFDGITYYNLPFVVGMAGGDGAFIVSNGTATVNNAAYVGGICSNAIPFSASNVWSPSKYLYARHDAKGLLAHRGGTLKFNKWTQSGIAVPGSGDVIVGSDGAGEVEVGPEGTFMIAGDLVLSNRSESVLHLISGKSAGTALAVGGRLVIADGAKLVADMRAFDGKSMWLKLMSADSVEGAFASQDVTILKPADDDIADYEIFTEHDGEAGVWMKRSMPQGVFALQWNPNYDVSVPYELTVSRAKLEALAGMDPTKGFIVIAKTANGPQELTVTLLADPIKADLVTLRFTVPEGTTGLTMKPAATAATVIGTDEDENLFAGALTSAEAARWIKDSSYMIYSEDAAALIITNKNGWGYRESYVEYPVAAEWRGKRVMLEMDVTGLSPRPFGSAFKLFQYDAGGNALPETVVDSRYTTQYRPFEKLVPIRAAGRIHPECATIRLQANVTQSSSTYGLDGRSIGSYNNASPSMRISRLVLRRAAELPFPAYDASFFTAGVSDEPGDEALVLNASRNFFFNAHSHGVWSEGKSPRGEADRFFPSAAGTFEAWIRPTTWSGVTTCRLLEGGRADMTRGSVSLDTSDQFIVLSYKPGTSEVTLTMRDARIAGRSRQTFTGSATGVEIPAGEWSHVALAWEPDGTADFYVNGVNKLSVSLSGFLAIDFADATRFPCPSDQWVCEAYVGYGYDQVKKLSNRTSIQPFVGALDCVRCSTGRRYTDNFTPAKRFEMDAQTRSLFTFDGTFDGRAAGGFGFVEGQLMAEKGRVAHDSPALSGGYYPAAVDPSVDPDRSISRANFPVNPDALDLASTRVETRKPVYMSPGGTTTFTVDAARVYPDFIEIGNESTTETIAYPVVLNAGEHDPRSWADLRETLYDPNASDLEKAATGFEYVVRATDYFGDYLCDYPVGSDTISSDSCYNSILKLNAYVCFECGPQNTLLSHVYFATMGLASSMTGGYGHSFEQVFYDGAPHLYDMSTTLRAFVPAFDNESVASLVSVETEPGVFERRGEATSHFIRMGQRECAAAAYPNYVGKIGVVLRPGERFRAWWANDGAVNDLRYQNKTVTRKHKFCPEYGNAMLRFRGAPIATSEAIENVTDDSFCYRVTSSYPIVAARYSASLKAGGFAPLSISTDDGVTWTDIASGAYLTHEKKPNDTYLVMARHDYLVKVGAAMDAVEALDFMTELMTNARTLPGRVKPGENTFRMKAESTAPARVVFGWSEPAPTAIGVAETVAWGCRAADVKRLAVYDPTKGEKSYALTGVSGAATVRVVKMPRVRGTDAAALTARIEGGALVLSAPADTPTFLAGVVIEDGSARQYLNVLVGANARLSTSAASISKATVEAGDGESSTPTVVHATPGAKWKFTFDSVPAGSYYTFNLSRMEGWRARYWGIVSMVKGDNNKVASVGGQNTDYGYWEPRYGRPVLEPGETPSKTFFKWDSPTANGVLQGVDLDAGTTDLKFYQWGSTGDWSDMAAVVVVPSGNMTEEVRNDLTKVMNGFMTDVARIDDETEYPVDDREDTSAWFVGTVAQGASDSNSGSRLHPFATVGKALAMVGTEGKRTIVLRDGTHRFDGSVELTKSCTIRGESAEPKKTVVDGQGLRRCLYVKNGIDVTVADLILQNGYADESTSPDYRGGAGIYSSYAGDLCVTNCLVRNCRDYRQNTTGSDIYFGGAGIYAVGYGSTNTHARIVDTVVENCSVTGYGSGGKCIVRGGGVHLSSATAQNLTVRGCSVTNTSSKAGSTSEVMNFGGGLYLGSYALVEQSTITGNWVSGEGAANVRKGGCGGGVCLDGGILRDSLVEGNVAAAFGAGVYQRGGTVDGCTIRGNVLRSCANTGRMQQGGAGACLSASDCLMKNCLIEENTLDYNGFEETSGAGLCFTGGQKMRVIDTVVRNNRGPKVPGLYASDTRLPGPILSNCVFACNVATGGVANTSDPVLKFYFCHGAEVTDTIFAGNIGQEVGTFYNYRLATIGIEGKDAEFAGILFRNCAFITNRVTNYHTPMGFNCSSNKDTVLGAELKTICFDHCSFVSNINWKAQNTYVFVGNSVGRLLEVKGCVFARNGRTNYSIPVCSEAVAQYFTNCYADNVPDGFVTDANGNKGGAGFDPKFVDAANGDFRPAKGSCLVDAGGPFEDWMGDGRSYSETRDLGDFGYTLEPVGTYGVKINHTNTNPRRSGKASDMGAAEFNSRIGTVLLVF